MKREVQSRKSGRKSGRKIGTIGMDMLLTGDVSRDERKQRHGAHLKDARKTEPHARATDPHQDVEEVKGHQREDVELKQT